MSRSQSYSSSHSHGGRSRGESSVSVTEASFQNLRVSEPASLQRSPRPSSYQVPDNRDPRSAYNQEDLALQYLQVGYNPGAGASTTSSLRSHDPSRLSPSLLSLDQENLGYIDPTAAFSPTDMSYTFAQGPMEGSYRAGDASPYVTSRSPSSLRDYAYSSSEASHRTSNSPSYGGRLDESSYGQPHPYLPSSNRTYNPPSYPPSYPPTTMAPGNYTQMPNIVTSQGRSPPGMTAPITGITGPVTVIEPRNKPQCWEHGCNGRQFSTFSNLLRHQREKSGKANKSTCPRCGAEFTRTTAMNGHLQGDKCKPRGSDDR